MTIYRNTKIPSTQLCKTYNVWNLIKIYQPCRDKKYITITISLYLDSIIVRRMHHAENYQDENGIIITIFQIAQGR